MTCQFSPQSDAKPSSYTIFCVHHLHCLSSLSLCFAFEIASGCSISNRFMPLLRPPNCRTFFSLSTKFRPNRVRIGGSRRVFVASVHTTVANCCEQFITVPALPPIRSTSNFARSLVPWSFPRLFIFVQIRSVVPSRWMFFCGG